MGLTCCCYIAGLYGKSRNLLVFLCTRLFNTVTIPWVSVHLEIVPVFISPVASGTPVIQGIPYSLAMIVQWINIFSLRSTIAEHKGTIKVILGSTASQTRISPVLDWKYLLLSVTLADPSATPRCEGFPRSCLGFTFSLRDFGFGRFFPSGM